MVYTYWHAFVSLASRVSVKKPHTKSNTWCGWWKTFRHLIWLVADEIFKFNNLQNIDVRDDESEGNMSLACNPSAFFRQMENGIQINNVKFQSVRFAKSDCWKIIFISVTFYCLARVSFLRFLASASRIFVYFTILILIWHHSRVKILFWLDLKLTWCTIRIFAISLNIYNIFHFHHFPVRGWNENWVSESDTNKTRTIITATTKTKQDEKWKTILSRFISILS